MVLNVHRNHRDRKKCGGGVWGGGGGRLYTYHYTVTTRMTYVLRWAAMRAILMFHNCEGKSHKTVSTDHSCWRERRAEAVSNRGPSAYQPNTLPLGQTGSQLKGCAPTVIYSPLQLRQQLEDIAIVIIIIIIILVVSHWLRHNHHYHHHYRHHLSCRHCLRQYYHSHRRRCHRSYSCRPLQHCRKHCL